jgi:hypothetical protein
MEAILNFCPPDGCRTMRRIEEMKREMSSRKRGGGGTERKGDWMKKN